MKTRYEFGRVFSVMVVIIGIYMSTVSVFAEGTCRATDTGVNIRDDASTSAKAIGSTTKDDKYDIHAKKTDSAGNVWYKITCFGDRTGYIRSDYVTDVQGDIPEEAGGSDIVGLGEEVEEDNELPKIVGLGEEDTERPYNMGEGDEEVPEEEEVEVTPEPTPVVNTDYELRYEPNDSGENIWYLYDNIHCTRQSLDNIFEVMQKFQSSANTNDSMVAEMKIILIAMTCVIALHFLVVLILVFELKD